MDETLLIIKSYGNDKNSVSNDFFFLNSILLFTFNAIIKFFTFTYDFLFIRAL